MHSIAVRAQARALLLQGQTLSQVSRELGVSRSALRAWRAGSRAPLPECPTCDGAPLVQRGYSALLGYYLGDGCVSQAKGCFTLRVSCDAAHPGVISDVAACIHCVRPAGKLFLVRAPGTVVVHSNWKHWPCLFPQHGPGRKHERVIELATWQQDIVDAWPADFLRGLFHSDGSRVNNWASRLVAGEPKRYDYPRWQFTNNSGDIQGLLCTTLDAVGVPWRHSNWKTISVSTRAGVTRLDELIGPKG